MSMDSPARYMSSYWCHLPECIWLSTCHACLPFHFHLYLLWLAL